MDTYWTLIGRVAKQHSRVLLVTSVAFVVLYYSGLLLLTMARFGEIPNYVVFHDIFHVYGLIFNGTPSLLDMIPILIDEAWFETGYKHPDYYGIATWSYMLIPPKMFSMLIMGLMVGFFAALVVYGRKASCQLKTDKRLYAAAGMSSVFLGLTSATLTWVVCCATPSWVVALAMLGMSASLALFLEPLGGLLAVMGLLFMLWIIFYQLKALLRADVSMAGRV